VGLRVGLLLLGGAIAIHLNAEQPGASRTLVASHVVDAWDGRGRYPVIERVQRVD
jgi:hypothetical protein